MSTTRTLKISVVFRRPFSLPGFDEPQLPGTYAVDIDEELLEDVSFPAYRRTGAWMELIDKSAPLGANERVWIEPRALDAALARDAADAKIKESPCE